MLLKDITTKLLNLNKILLDFDNSFKVHVQNLGKRDSKVADKLF